MAKSISTVHKQAGYTLIEVLIVLAIMVFFLTITMTRYNNSTVEYPPKDFFDQFEKDVFYFQQRASTYQTPITITFNTSQNYYYIHDPTHQPSYMRRPYNSDINIYLSTLKNPLRFNTDGTIINPGSLLLIYKDSKYELTFPFGKGRFYVTKVS